MTFSSKDRRHGFEGLREKINPETCISDDDFAVLANLFSIALEPSWSVFSGHYVVFFGEVNYASQANLSGRLH